MSRNRIVITGVGGVSGAGRDPEAMLDAIIDGRSAIRPIEGFDTTGWPVKDAAEIVDFNARALVDDRKLHKLIRRTDMLGIYAGDRAAEAAGYAAYRGTLAVDASNLFADRTGIYVGSGAGAFENQHDFYPLMSETKGDLQAFGRNLADTVNPMWLLRTLPNNVLCHVGIRNGAGRAALELIVRSPGFWAHDATDVRRIVWRHLTTYPGGGYWRPNQA